MARVPIADLDDPRLDIYRSLKATNQTRGLEQFVVEGERLVERLLASRFPTASVLMTDRHAPKFLARIPDAVPTFVVSHDGIDLLVGFPFHRGILASGYRRPWLPIDDLLRASDGACTLVLCPKVSNPENLGAIARIGDAFGIDAIVCGPNCPDPFSRRVLRVSMGAVLSLPVLVSDHFGATMDDLARKFDVKFFAAVADPNSEPFESVTRPRRVGLVLGDEHEGIDFETLKRCDSTVTIPMRAGASSLNVAVAAGILIYGLTRDVPSGSPCHSTDRGPGPAVDPIP